MKHRVMVKDRSGVETAAVNREQVPMTAVRCERLLVPPRQSPKPSGWMEPRGARRYLDDGAPVPTELRPEGEGVRRPLVIGALAYRLESVLSNRTSVASGDGETGSSLPFEASPGVLGALRDWWDFLYYLMRVDSRFSFQLRFTKPEGLGRPIEQSIIVRATAPDGLDPRAALEDFQRDLHGLLMLNARVFELVPVETGEALEKMLDALPGGQVVELFPREAMGMGDGGYQYFPYRLRPADMGRVLEALSVFAGTIRYAVTLAPTDLTGPEHAHLQGMHGTGREGPYVEGRRFEMRVHVEADRRVPRDLLHRIGFHIAGYPGRMIVAEWGPMDSDGCLRGGVQVQEPGTAEERELAAINLRHGRMLPWERSIAPEPLSRVRNLVDALDASTAFRLPFPGVTGGAATGALPGPPLDLPHTEGAPLGVLRFCGMERRVNLSDADAAYHTYLVGKTGTGKSTLLLNMVLSRIAEGHGVAVIDPHGDLALDVASRIPKERIEDVIFFEPTDETHAIGLNLVEYDHRYPEQKTFVIGELLKMFDVLYNMEAVSGPIFFQYFRYAFLALLDDPELTPDITYLNRFLSDKRFRNQVLERCPDPMVCAFWREEAGKAGGEMSLSNMTTYISSKLAPFVANDLTLPIIGQSRSGIDFQEVLDSGKILLVRLDKGRIGSKNTHLLGMVLVMRILMAALARSRMPKEDRRPFHLFVDEFQTLVSPSIGELLSEARKYALRLTLANQHTRQISEELREAIVGNVGTTVSFQVGPGDAGLVAHSMGRPELAVGLVGLEKFRALVQTNLDGRVLAPFALRTPPPPPPGDDRVVERIRARTRFKYARPRKSVIQEIRARYIKRETD